MITSVAHVRRNAVHARRCAGLVGGTSGLVRHVLFARRMRRSTKSVTHTCSRLLLAALAAASSACTTDPSAANDPQDGTLATRVDELETTVASLQMTVTALDAALEAQADRLPRPLGRIALGCATPTSCSVESFSFGNQLTHAGGGLRVSVPETFGKSLLVVGRINLELSGAAIDGVCQYGVTWQSGATYRVLRSAVYSVRANETLDIPLTFAAFIFDGIESGPSQIEVFFNSPAGAATCSIASYETAELSVMAFDGLPPM